MDVFTAKLLLSVAIATCVAGSSLLVAGWSLLDAYGEIRRGPDEQAPSHPVP